jgi:hypothetical protein
MGGVDVQIEVLLVSVLVGGKRSASRPYGFTPGEGSTGIHWVGSWVGHRSVLDDMESENS